MAKTPAICLSFRAYAAGGGEHVVLRGADLDTAALRDATAHNRPRGNPSDPPSENNNPSNS
jgi:hypothetical protein